MLFLILNVADQTFGSGIFEGRLRSTKSLASLTFSASTPCGERTYPSTALTPDIPSSTSAVTVTDSPTRASVVESDTARILGGFLSTRASSWATQTAGAFDRISSFFEKK